MCEYCKQKIDNKIVGKQFQLQETAGFKKDRIYSSWIMKLKADEKAGIMITTNGTNGVFFDINYCPMCGRKLIKVEDKR